MPTSPTRRSCGASSRAALLGPETTQAPTHEPPATSEPTAPPWLPPRHQIEAIKALRDRYPYELHHLGTDVFADTLRAEQLAALAVWRALLDAGGYSDPRMELAFSHELRGFADWLHTRDRTIRRTAPETAR